MEEKALRQFTAFGGQINASPQGFPFFLAAVYWQRVPNLEIQVIGEDAGEMLRIINSLYLPEALLITAAPARDQSLNELIPSLAGKNPFNDAATVFICRGSACQAPTSDPKGKRNPR